LADGFTSLGDDLLLPDAALLDRPGRQLAQGSFAGLTVDGSLEDGGRVLAMRYEDDEAGFTVVPFLDDESCEIFPAVNFERVSSRINLDLPAIVAVQTTRDETGRGQVRFVDFKCQDVLAPLEDANLPRVPFPDGMARGLLLLADSNTLYFIDAEQKEQKLVAKDVQRARVSGSKLWTIESGVLVGRDEDLVEIARIGSAVEDFAPDVGQDDVAFLEGGELFGWKAGKDESDEDEGSSDTLRQIAEDACHLEAPSPKILAYYSPCAERKLELEVAASAVGLEGANVKIRGPKDTLLETNINFGFDKQPSRIIVLQNSEPDASAGELLWADIPVGPELEDDRVIELEWASLGEDISYVGGSYVQSFDGVQGTLMDFKEADDEAPQLRKLLEGVTQLPGITPFDDPGVLTGFDGTSGTLVRLGEKNGKLTQKVLTERVPLQSITSEGESIAYVGNFDGAFGDVFLLDDDDLEAVAQDAMPGTLRFLDQPRAVAYLGKSKAKSGAALHAYLTDSGIDLLIADGVNEYRGLPWPSPGVLYSVWEGENAGLWLSKAR